MNAVRTRELEKHRQFSQHTQTQVRSGVVSHPPWISIINMSLSIAGGGSSVIPPCKL